MSPSLFQENRRTLALAAPIMAGHVGQMLMGLVDTVMVGRVGVVPLAACAFANTVLSVPFVFGFGVLSAVSVRAAHAYGSNAPEEAAAVARGGFLIALLLGVPFAVAAHVLLPGIAVLGQPAEVNDSVGTYLLLCAWSMIPAYWMAVSKSFCEAFSRPWAPFWIVIGGVFLNIFLNWVFIFGNLGVPAMGLEGAGVATLLARIASAVVLFLYPRMVRGLREAWPRGRLLAGSLGPARILLRIGLPAGGMHLFEVSGFAFGSLMMGWISVNALAAHQIAIICAATTFMVPLGLSQALCVRVGQSRGSGRLESLRPIILGGGLLAVGIMSLFMAGFIFGGRFLAAAFIDEPEVVALTAQLLMLAGIFQIFDGLQIVAAGTLRGFEDTRVPMLIGIFSYWVVALPVSYTGAFVLGWGAPAVWGGFVVGLAVAAFTLSIRVRKKLLEFSPKPLAAA